MDTRNQKDCKEKSSHFPGCDPQRSKKRRLRQKMYPGCVKGGRGRTSRGDKCGRFFRDIHDGFLLREEDH